MKSLATLGLLFAFLFGNYAEEMQFQAGMDVFADHIWRGFHSSEHASYESYLSVNKNAWSGVIWAWYDTNSESSLMDYQGDWREIDLALSHSWNVNGTDKLTAGIIYYSVICNSFYDYNDLYLSYQWDKPWNPKLSVYWDFDPNEGFYYSFDISKSKKDRDWTYTVGLKLGWFDSYGDRIFDPQIDSRSGAPVGWGGRKMTGMGDIEPKIVLSKNLDQDSFLSLTIKASILTDRSTYEWTQDDAISVGLGYHIKF